MQPCFCSAVIRDPFRMSLTDRASPLRYGASQPQLEPQSPSELLSGIRPQVCVCGHCQITQNSRSVLVSGLSLTNCWPLGSAPHSRDSLPFWYASRLVSCLHLSVTYMV